MTTPAELHRPNNDLGRIGKVVKGRIVWRMARLGERRRGVMRAHADWDTAAFHFGAARTKVVNHSPREMS
jgi:hypothetical protein